MAKKLLPSKAEQSSEWYTTLVQLADLADYGPAKGTMILKPYGYALWEAVQEKMNPMIKARGVGTSIYYPQPVARMTYYRQKYGYRDGQYPNAERIADAGIALPVGPHLNEDDMAYIIAEPCQHSKDGSCRKVCPVKCIHPGIYTSDDGTVYDQLFIHPFPRRRGSGV